MEPKHDNSSQSSPINLRSQQSRSLSSISSSASLNYQELQSDPGTLRHEEHPAENKHLNPFWEAGNDKDNKNEGLSVHEKLKGPSNHAGGNDRHQQRKDTSTIPTILFD